MDTWLKQASAWEDGFEMDQFLHSLSIVSTIVTKQIAEGLRKSNECSPSFGLYKANMNALLWIRR